jgi:hypothetical protein
VNGFVSGVTARFSFAVTWMLAAALGLGAMVAFLLPTAARLLGQDRQPGVLVANPVLSFTLVAAGAGVLSGALATPLYRVLEGYVWWPAPLQAWGIERQRRRYRRLEISEGGTALQLGLRLERLNRYPAAPGQFAPTRFGNAMRAFETYGLDRYRLDSQTLWTELFAVSHKAVQDEVAGARVGTDFLVALLYWTAIYGLAALGIAGCEQLGSAHRTDGPMIVQGLLALVGGPLVTYNWAVATVRYQSSTVRAMVNLGRPRLAEALGLAMPRTAGEEQELWELLGRFVRNRRDDEVAARLDAFRSRAGQQDPDEGPGPPPLRRFRRPPPVHAAGSQDAGTVAGQTWTPAQRLAMGGMVALLAIATAALVVATLLPQAVAAAAATLFVVGVLSVLAAARALLT